MNININDLTEQEMFDAAYNGVVRQGRPAMSVHSRVNRFVCAYRAHNGDMCAAGHVLKECYPRDWAGWTMKGDFSELITQHDIKVDGDVETFILALQEAHDTDIKSEAYIDEYKERMRKIARRNVLNFIE